MIFFFLALLIEVEVTRSEETLQFRQTANGMVVSDQLPLPASNPNYGWALDPFEKLPGFSTVQEEEEEFVLAGVLGQDRSGAAIIDDQVVEVGASVGNRKLRKIGSGYVLLEKGGSVIELPLQKSNDATPGRSLASSVKPKVEPEAPAILKIEEIK